MTSPRAALTRQDLPKLLGVLKAAGAGAAEFFPDGRLQSVRFGPVEPPAEKPAAPEKPTPERWAPQRNALAVLQGGKLDMDGEPLE